MDIEEPNRIFTRTRSGALVHFGPPREYPRLTDPGFTDEELIEVERQVAAGEPVTVIPTGPPAAIGDFSLRNIRPLDTED